jgi:hypothetical protein
MKTLKLVWATALCGAIVLGAPAFATLQAAEVNTYQVTGPILDVTPNTIVVQKGKDRWELARDASTKVSGDLKVGAKVTITYKMVAQGVEVKEDKSKKK